MDFKCDERREIIIEVIWKECILHLNELVVSLFDNLRQKSFKSSFMGRPLHFITQKSLLSLPF